MGVGGLRMSWQNQTHYFGHVHGDRYSLLILDNRGSGSSSKPLGRYTTSSLALDAIEVLDAVGWTSPRSVHLLGISLGGMIAQEVAHAAPGRIRSLSLICTSSYVTHKKSFAENLRQRTGVLKWKSERQAIADAAVQIFNEDWLLAPDEAVLPDPKSTPKCGIPEGSAADPDGFAYRHFDSNFQRFMAGELVKRRGPQGWYSKKGVICQLIAASGHYKSPAQLQALADVIGRERIMVVHGTGDQMIDFENGQVLMDVLEPGTKVVVEGMSHTPVLDRPRWFNELVEERIVAWEKVCENAE